MAKRMIPGFTILSALSVLTLTHSSGASDPKVYPGTLCTEAYDMPPLQHIRHFENAARNEHSGVRPWSCPIVRDNLQGTITNWAVTVNRMGDLNSNWTFTITSGTKEGLGGFADTITIPKVSGVQDLVGGFVNNKMTGGVYYIVSWVPSDAWVYRYMVNES